MGVPTRIIKRGMLGKPVLEAGGNGKAAWTTTEAVASDNHQVTYAARLDAGKQTSWNDFAKVVIPVNEMPFTDLDSVRLEAYYSTTVDGCIDMGVCLYLHDPADLDQRIELSHTPKTSSTTAGWRELNYPTNPQDEGLLFFWYGDESVIAEVLTEGTGYSTLAQFKADAVFKSWTIYKITLDYGYHTGDTVMNSCYLAQAIISYGTASGSKVKEAILLEPSSEEQISDVTDKTTKAIKSLPTWKFGDPVLRSAGVSKVGWVQDPGNVEALFQKGTSGYLANLYGGVQDGDDWAAVYIPVNELPVPDFTSALWTYRLTNAEACGVNIVIWVHDPTDFNKRCEITQVMGLVDHADGWNAHELDTSVSQFFFYGEGESGNTTCTTEGTNYTWAQYQADALFSTWTIYRISLEYGWIASSTLDDAWVADVKLNGQIILLKPQPWDVIGRETKSYFKVTAGNSTADVVLVTPAATKRIQVLSLNMITTSATASNFECYFSVADAMPAAKVIAVRNLDTDAVAEHFVNFGDNGPKGDIGEVVSMRTSVDITTNGTYTIVYKEV